MAIFGSWYIWNPKPPERIPELEILKCSRSYLMAKLIHLFFNMDKMVGGDFEKGLTELKSLLESPVTGQMMKISRIDVE